MGRRLLALRTRGRARRPQRDRRDRSRPHVLDRDHPAATVYPDSDKVAIWTGNRADDLMTTRSSSVDYWFGEVDLS